MITVPQLDPVSQIQATDVIIITHADGSTEKITGENFMKAMAVDVIAENNMYSVTSNAVAEELKVISGVITLLDNTMNIGGMLQKQGKRVTMSVRIWKEGETTVNAGQVLAVLPEGFRPKNNVNIFFNINNFDSINTHQLLTADWYGSIYTVLQQTYSRLDFYLSGSWFTE